MSIYPFSVRLLTALRRVAIAVVVIAFVVLIVGGATVAHAQQTPKYSLDAGGQKLQLEAISFGNGGASQPESGAATLKRHMLSDSPSLEDLARTRSQPKLYLRFRDAQSNGLVQYNFDDVKFGRYTQIGTGPDAVETLAITYDAFAVSAPGLRRKPSIGISRNVAHAPHKAVRSAPRRQGLVPAGTVRHNKKKPQVVIVR
jgi:hypothetical protein